MTSCSDNLEKDLKSLEKSHNDIEISTKSSSNLIVPNLVDGMLSFVNETEMEAYFGQILDMESKEREKFENEYLNGFVSQSEIYDRIIAEESKLVNPQIDSLRKMNKEINYDRISHSELFLEKKQLGIIVDEVGETGEHSLQIGGDVFLAMIANENGMYSVAGQVYTNSRESLANKPVLYAEGVRGKQFEKKFYWNNTKECIFRVWTILDVRKKDSYYWAASLRFRIQLQDLSGFAIYYNDIVEFSDMNVSGYYTYANPLPPYNLVQKQLSYKLSYDGFKTEGTTYEVTYPIPNIDPKAPELVFANVVLPSGIAQLQPISDVYIGLEHVEFHIHTQYVFPTEDFSISFK